MSGHFKLMSRLKARIAKPSVPLPQQQRPSHWAQPIALAGAANLHRVTDWLYRSEQPDEVGMRHLTQFGIRTVINLRGFNSDTDVVQGLPIANPRVRVHTWRVRDHHVLRVLTLLRQPERGPFLIHCLHGADRTGLMVAMFRIVEQGWSKSEALAELMHGGFGYHGMWKNIQRYILSADIAALRDGLASLLEEDAARARRG